MNGSILREAFTSVNPQVATAGIWYAALMGVVTDALEDSATLYEAVSDHESIAFGLWEPHEMKAVMCHLERLLSVLQASPPSIGSVPRL